MMVGEVLVTIGVLLLCGYGVGWLIHDIDKQCKEYEEKHKNE